MKKYWKAVILALIALVFVWVALNWKAIRDFPQVLPSFSAKEFCSCYFVNQQTEIYCRELVRQYLPLKSLEIDESSKEVRATGYFGKQSARYVSERFGCELF